MHSSSFASYATWVHYVVKVTLHDTENNSHVSNGHLKYLFESSLDSVLLINHATKQNLRSEKEIAPFPTLNKSKRTILKYLMLYLYTAISGKKTMLLKST